jgi:hypothetical protein
VGWFLFISLNAFHSFLFYFYLYSVLHAQVDDGLDGLDHLPAGRRLVLQRVELLRSALSAAREMCCSFVRLEHGVQQTSCNCVFLVYCDGASFGGFREQHLYASQDLVRVCARERERHHCIFCYWNVFF